MLVSLAGEKTVICLAAVAVPALRLALPGRGLIPSWDGRLWLGWDFEDLGLGWRGRAWPLPVRVVASCTERPYQPDAEDKESEVPDSGVHSTNYTAGLTSRAKRMNSIEGFFRHNIHLPRGSCARVF